MNTCTVIMSYYVKGPSPLISRTCASIRENAVANPTLRWVIVDDCSPWPYPDFHHRNLTVARILADIPHNNPGGRNLALHLTATDWVIGFDMDNFASPAVFAELIHMDADPDTMYQLCCDRGNGYDPDRPSKGTNYTPNLFMARKDRLLSFGGYDEDFAGHYGTEDRWMHDCWRRAGFTFARTKSNPVEDAIGIGYTGLRRDLTRNRSLREEKRATGANVQPGLRFKWEMREE